MVVDGRANAATVLTLSHWPQAPCPPDLRRDLSAESALAYLSTPSRHGEAELVTNNHFDQDGLMSVYALVRSAGARPTGPIGWSRWPGPGTSRSRPHPTPPACPWPSPPAPTPTVPPSTRRCSPAATTHSCAHLYAELLAQVSQWLDDPGTCRALWADEDAQLEADQALLASGRVTVEEVPELDLTVVTLPAGTSSTGGHRFGGMWSDLIHPLALHEVIDGFAVLLSRTRPSSCATATSRGCSTRAGRCDLGWTWRRWPRS